MKAANSATACKGAGRRDWDFQEQRTAQANPLPARIGPQLAACDAAERWVIPASEAGVLPMWKPCTPALRPPKNETSRPMASPHDVSNRAAAAPPSRRAPQPSNENHPDLSPQRFVQPAARPLQSPAPRDLPGLHPRHFFCPPGPFPARSRVRVGARSRDRHWVAHESGGHAGPHIQPGIARTS